MIRVWYDSQTFSTPRGGIGNSFSRLIREFVSNSSYGVRPSAVPYLTANQEYADLPGALYAPPVLRSKGRAIRLVNALPGGLCRTYAGLDIVHPTYYFTPLPRVRRSAYVVTIHDMIPELFPELFQAGNPHPFKKQNVGRADAILTVSATTANDLNEVYGDLQKPILVSPLAPAQVFDEAASLPRTNRVVNYVIYVGERHGHKGFPTFVRAMEILKHLNMAGVVVGRPLRDYERALIAHAGLEGRISVMQPTDHELALLYRDALAYVSTSRYEGFGLPVVEAMATGCACILTDIPVYREIASRGAKFYAVGDAEELSDRISALLNDPRELRNLRDGARIHASGFTIERTARLTVDLYQLAQAART